MTNIVDIAVQNDDFRKHLSKGTLVLTRGIRSNTSEDIKKIITKVRTFDLMRTMTRIMNTILVLLIIRGKRFSGKLTTMIESFFIFHQM